MIAGMLPVVRLKAGSPFEKFLDRMIESGFGEKEENKKDPVQQLEENYPPTHEVVSSFSLMKNNESIPVHSFCVDPEGNLLVACGIHSITFDMQVEMTIETETGKEITAPTEIRVFSPEGKLLESISTVIIPLAMNTAPDGTLYIASRESIQQIDRQGRVLQLAENPLLSDREKLFDLCRKQAEKIIKGYVINYRHMVESNKALLKSLTARPEDERSEFQKKHIERAEKELEVLEKKIKEEGEKAFKVYGSLEKLTLQILSSRLNVAGLAVSEGSVFVSVPGEKQNEYSIWKMSRELKNPVEIITGLSGYCGQMDIQVRSDALWIAENGKHQVCRYSFEGELLSSFGQKGSILPEGFGEMYNPMNIQIDSQGNILTSETSTGLIKKFSREGQFISFVGKVDVDRGCFRSAIGFSPDEKKIYYLNILNRTVDVLSPREAP